MTPLKESLVVLTLIDTINIRDASGRGRWTLGKIQVYPDISVQHHEQNHQHGKVKKSEPVMLVIQYGATSLTISHFVSLKTEISFANKQRKRNERQFILTLHSNHSNELSIKPLHHQFLCF